VDVAADERQQLIGRWLTEAIESLKPGFEAIPRRVIEVGDACRVLEELDREPEIARRPAASADPQASA
jgi:hypothetical protein